MTVVLSSNSSEHGFSISNIISRFRSKKSTKSKPVEKQTQHHTSPEKRPHLIPSPLPLILPQHQHTLPTLGWTTITFPQPQDPSPSNPHPPGPHPLQTAYESLFVASQAFFDLPASTKSQWKHKLGSEEGWSSIPGEKEFITLRSLEYCPDILREPAKTYWDLMGTYLTSSLSRIATSLAMSDPEALTRFVGPCASIQPTDALKTATMLRLFRYEGWDAKVVAEPHSDLGLLSVVVGNVPGLEVWDGHAWFDVEREVQRAEMQGASLLVGRQLERLSNGRYGAGEHRVVSYGAAKPAETQDAEKRYRFSIVFVLRAHEPVVIESDELETEITGKWDEPLKGMTAGKMYDEIRGRHYNINIGVEEREKQRRNVEMGKVG